MKKPSVSFLLFSTILILVTLLFAETLVVKVQTTHLRKEPKFYGQTIAVLTTGETVEKISSQNGWIQVKTSKGLVGWIHSSAAEEKKFNLLTLGQSTKTQATAGEVALAAKGFNKQVEDKYKANNPQTAQGFLLVEKMLKIEISPSKMVTFFKNGKLGEYRSKK